MSKIDEQVANDLLTIAHRGGVVNEMYYENSIEGLEEAIRRGYSHVEVDVRITRDSQLVCFHERNLSEITGIDKNIDELALAELRKIAASLNAQIFPTFDEYCARCAGRIKLMVDLKGAHRSAAQYLSLSNRKNDDEIRINE